MKEERNPSGTMRHGLWGVKKMGVSRVTAEFLHEINEKMWRLFRKRGEDVLVGTLEKEQV